MGRGDPWGLYLAWTLGYMRCLCCVTPCRSSPQGRKWWMDTEEPWQVLACCMEIARASRVPDPAAYVSYFPVHQVRLSGMGEPRETLGSFGGPGLQ